MVRVLVAVPTSGDDDVPSSAASLHASVAFHGQTALDKLRETLGHVVVRCARLSALSMFEASYVFYVDKSDDVIPAISSSLLRPHAFLNENSPSFREYDYML